MTECRRGAIRHRLAPAAALRFPRRARRDRDRRDPFALRGRRESSARTAPISIRAATRRRLCPTDTFDRQPLYRSGRTRRGRSHAARRVGVATLPSATRNARSTRVRSRARRRGPLGCALDRLGVSPRLFEGRLPDFNLGTADGTSCDPSLARSLFDALQRHTSFTSVAERPLQGRAHHAPLRRARERRPRRADGDGRGDLHGRDMPVHLPARARRARAADPSRAARDRARFRRLPVR